MRQRAFHVTEEQACELQGAYHNCQDALTHTRYQAVRLYGLGYATREIETICGCSRSSLMEWCRNYQAAGVAGLVDQRLGGNRALLTPPQIERLQYLLESYAPGQLLATPRVSGLGSSGRSATWHSCCRGSLPSATRARPPCVSCWTSAASVISVQPSSISRVRRSRSPNSKNSLKKTDRHGAGRA